MSFLKLFNKNYLIQNLKKSRGALAVFLALVPLFSVLTLVVRSLNDDSLIIFNMLDISYISMIFLYIIPIALSVMLFGFVFKKRSVDFVNSMPISKKSIFVTNAIGGILIIFILMIINSLLLVVVDLLFANITIPIKMIIDYFIIWTISYIFMFSTANLAMTISGNLITQIVVTILLVCFVPFWISFANSNYNADNLYVNVTCNEKDCTPNKYLCYSDNKAKYCEESLANNSYEIYETKVNEIEYNYPYMFISQLLFSYNLNTNLYFPTAFYKTLILSVVYIIIASMLFKRKKMENCETSFKTIHAHSIVKCLTITPLLLAIYLVIDAGEAFSAVIILQAILIAYYFIYDLITRRGIREIGTGLLYLICTYIVVLGAYLLITNYQNNYLKSFNVNEVKKVNLINRDYEDMDENLLEAINNNLIAEKDLINYIFKQLLTNVSDTNCYTTLRFKVILDNNKVYYFENCFSKEQYEFIMNKLISDNKVQKEFKSYDFDKTFAVGFESFLIESNYNKLLDLIKEELQDSDLKEYVDFEGYEFDGTKVYLYSYENHQLKIFEARAKNSLELYKYISKLYHSKYKETLNNRDVYRDLSYVYFNNDADYKIDDLNYLYQLENSPFDAFIKEELEKDFDCTKPYVIINMYAGRHYKIYSNDVEKFKNIINKVRSYWESTDVYKTYFYYDEEVYID